MPATPAAADHDNILVYRLVQLLIKLNQGEKLNPKALAEEFGVTRRTIQRDLNERLHRLDLEKTGGCYHLKPTRLGKISASDMEHFASLAGVRGLFPSLSMDFLRDVFDARIQSARLVKGPHYEDLGGREHSFETLEQAILARHRIAYAYLKKEGLKTYTDVEPYKLITNLFIRKVIMTHTGTRVAKRKTSPVLVISECGAMHRVPAASFRPLIAPVAWPLAA